MLPWKREEYINLRNILYTMKDRDDPILSYLVSIMDVYTLFYLLNHPSLFISQDLFNSFREENESSVDNTKLYTELMLLYFYTETNPTSTFKPSILTDIETAIEQGLTNDLTLNTTPNVNRTRLGLIHEKLTRYNTQLIDTKINKIRQDENVPSTTKNNVKLQQVKYSTLSSLTNQHEQTLISQVNKLDTLKDSSITSLEDVSMLQLKQSDYLSQQNLRIGLNLTTMFALTQMQMRLTNRPVYKVWRYTPNPRTRHSHMDGQKVLLDRKFTVTNEISGDTEYMDYPGQWGGTPSNTYNCMCYLEFTNS